MELIFDPKIADLQAIVSDTSLITTIDLTNESELEVFKACQKTLQQARLKVTNTGKALRDESNAYSKAVIAREKELLAVIEPEEQRLKNIKEDAEHAELLKVRASMTPVRVEEMAKAGLTTEQLLTTEQMMEMDGNQFVEYIALKVQENNEAELTKFRAEKELRDKADNDLKHAQDIKDAQEKAVIAERERAEKAKAEADEKAKKDAEVEKLKLQSEVKYQNFLKENGWTEETKDQFVIEKGGNKVRLSRILATYIIQ